MTTLGQSKRSLFTKKFIGTLFAVFALLAQPLAVLPVANTFAVTGAIYFVRTDGNDTNCDGTLDVVDTGSPSSQCAKQTIQAAVDTASNGDTINIGLGTFTEAVSITKSLALVGETKAGTRIHAPVTMTGSDAIVKMSGAGVSTEIRRLTVEGPGPSNCGSIYAGIYVTGSANATLRNLDVTSIRDAVFSGCQNGRAIYIGGAGGIGTASITNVAVTDYQKGGIYVSNAGSSAVVTNSTIIGAGATSTIAQNGMAAINGAQLNVVNTSVRQNKYTPDGTIATGVLFFSAAPTSSVSADSNIKNNEIGVYTTDAALVPNISLASAVNNVRNVVTDTTGLPTPSVTYVVDSLIGTADSDGNDVVSVAGGNHVYGYDAFSNVQSGINAVATSGTVSVLAGNYNGDVTINRAMSLVGPNGAINPVTNPSSRAAEAVITGQVSVYAGGADVKGLTITNPSWNGVTIKGVHVYGSGGGINGVTVENNIFDSIHNANNKGAYGVMVQGAVSNVNVTSNVVNDLVSVGWAHAVEVTPAGGVATVPQNVKVTGNKVQGVSNASGTDQYDFSVDASGSTTAKATQITFTKNLLSGNVRNLDTAHDLNASQNWWGTGTGVNGPSASQYSGDVVVAPWCEQAACTSFMSRNQTANFPLSGVNEAVTSGLTTLVGSTPSGDVTVTLQNGTTITSNGSWDGTLIAPTVTTTTIPATPGFDTTSGLVIKVGSDSLSFSVNPSARLVLPGQAGKHVGFQAPGGSFTEITNVCVADAQPTAPVNECKMDVVGGDLVIWTNHFTTFATYTLTKTVTPLALVSLTQTKSSGSLFPSFFSVVPSTASTSSNQSQTGEVLGTATDTQTKTGDKTAADTTTKIFGFAWYWWIPILAILGGLTWFIVRRRSAE